MAIQSFGDKQTEEFYIAGKLDRKTKWKSVSKVVFRKLDMINYANKLEDLKSPPNNRLEKLKGDLKDFYSIRINDQWRIVFVWTDKGAEDVRIVDYH